MKINPLQKAIKIAMLASAVMAVSMPAAYAADEADEGLEEVVVTGTRIKNLNLESFSPVTTIKREDLLATGVTDIGDLLNSSPISSGSPIGTTTNNGGSGAVQVDLRGFGAARTLVLIDGVRTVEGNDFQTIPAAMIERVDLALQGAGAVYGSDAVAGVINVITRKDIEGIELTAETNWVTDVTDDTVDTYSFAAGKTFDNSNIQFIAEYAEQDAATQSDYPYEFFQYPYYLYDQNGSIGTYLENGIVGPNTDPNNYSVIILGSSRVPGGNFRLAEDATNPVNGVTYSAGDRLTRDLGTGEFRPYLGNIFDVPNDTYNYAPVNYIQTPYKKFNLYSAFETEITDNVEFSTSLRYNKRSSEQLLAPVPYNSGTDPSYADIVPGVAISGDNYYNVFGADLNDARRRMIERPRSFTQDVSQFQIVSKFSGSLMNDLNWQAQHSFGQRETTSIDYGQLNGVNLALALGPSFLDGSGNVVCGTAAAPVAGCVSADFFSGPGGVTDAMYDYIGTTLIDSLRTQQHIYSAGVDSVFTFGGRDFGWAAGVERREQDLRFIPDSAKVAGTVTGNKTNGTVGEDSVDSVYFEVGSTLFDNGQQTFDATVGTRYDDYETAGGTTNSQFGMKFQAIDGVVLRADYAEVFRAPSIGALFGGGSDGFPTANDPCSNRHSGAYTPVNCPAGTVDQPDTQLLARGGGNPNLLPEEGENTSFGIIYQPSFVDGLNLSLDFWKVELESSIGSISTQGILDFCHDPAFNLQSQCGAINRRADGSIAFVQTGLQNISNEEVSGWDFQANYMFDIPAWGSSMRTNLVWTRIKDQLYQPDPASDVEQLAGTFSEAYQLNSPEDKANLTAVLTRGPLTLTYGAEYVRSIWTQASFTGESYKVPTSIYHDISAAYEINDDLTVSGGFGNITNEDPPYFDSGFNASTDPSTYRIGGTTAFIRAAYKFK